MFGNKENKEDKVSFAQKLVNDYIEKYGLEDLDKKDYEIVKLIRMTAEPTNTMAMLKLDHQTQAIVSSNMALISQNWLILKELKKLNKQKDNQ